MQTKNKPLERVLSKERLGAYQAKWVQGMPSSPIALYRWNTLLSESFYPILQTIEVILRNAMHLAISEHFQDSTWLLNPAILEHKDYIEVQKQEGRLTQHRQPTVTRGNIIAELSFGFWTGLLDAHYEMKFWRSKIIKKTFPHMLPRDRMRHKLFKHFNKIRKLRNRIFHYEPIWYWQDLKKQHEDIRLAIGWIEPAALKLCTPDRFDTVYEQGPTSMLLDSLF